MNRLTHAFSSAIANTDYVPLRVPTPSDTPRQSSEPPGPGVSGGPGSIRHARSQQDFRDGRDGHLGPGIMYDDPRLSHFDSGPDGEEPNGESSSGRKARSNVRMAFGRGEGGKRGWGVSTIPGSGRVTAMAKGPNGKYAVGGGQYLSVLQVHHERGDPSKLDKVEQVVNLWKGNWGVSKSVTDLDWGDKEMSNKVFSATPSGTFLIFDVNRGKLDREVQGGHPRPINVLKVCKSQSHTSLVITGGTEGQAKVWDLRQREPRMLKYYKHAGPITSLAFAPDSSHHFLVGLDNGSIQRYDMRYQYKAIGRVWGAHGNKAVMDLKWKDGDNGWLASAGEDRTVQIWDMSHQWDRTPTPTHTLHTAHPLRRIAWRPGPHSTELVVVPSPTTYSAIDPTIASIPQGLESFQATEEFCEIWDVRRHHVAKYAVPLSEGNPIDLDWWNEDTLMGAFPGSFASIDIREHLLPLEQLPRQVMCWNSQGEFVYGVDRFKPGEIPFDDLTPEMANHWTRVGKASKSISDPPHESLQAFGVASLPDTDPEEFEYLASQYKLEGGGTLPLCQWNRSVAELCGRHDDARIWAFLEILIEEFLPRSITPDPFSAAQLKNPSLPSPTLSPRQQAQDARPNGAVAQSMVTAPISLERIDDTLDDIEELLGSAASSSSSSSGSQTSGSSSGSSSSDDRLNRSRVMTFAPPTNKQITDLTASARRSLPSSAMNSPPTIPSTSGKGTPRPLLAQLTNNQRTLFERRASNQQSQGQSESRSSGSSDGDYPDPYGVLPFADLPMPLAAMDRERDTHTPGSSNPATHPGSSSGSATTARASLATSRILPDPPSTQSQSHSQLSETGSGSRHSNSQKGSPLGSRKPSPQVQATRMESPMRRVQLPPMMEKPNTPPVGPGSKTGDGAVVTGTPIWATPAGERPAVGGVEEYGKVIWGEYKASRTAPFLSWWKSYVDDGEVQLASTMYIVGRHWVDFPAIQAERTVHAYIEMLEAHRLSVQAAYIRKHAGIDSVEVRPSDDGVTHVVHCTNCGRSTGSVEISPKEGTFWWCKRCKRDARQCVVCHQAVKGLYLGCRRCNHGGHQQCMRLYYSFLLVEGDMRTASPTSASAASHTRTSTEKSEKSGASAETLRSSAEPEGGGGGSSDGVAKMWHPCASGGCDCHCRTVVGPI